MIGVWNYILMSLLFLFIYWFYYEEDRIERFVFLAGYGVIIVISLFSFSVASTALVWLMLVMCAVYLTGVVWWT